MCLLFNIILTMFLCFSVGPELNHRPIVGFDPWKSWRKKLVNSVFLEAILLYRYVSLTTTPQQIKIFNPCSTSKLVSFLNEQFATLHKKQQRQFLNNSKLYCLAFFFLTIKPTMGRYIFPLPALVNFNSISCRWACNEVLWIRNDLFWSESGFYPYYLIIFGNF